MMVDDQDMTVARGMALHKMIRLVTLATINGGYLNFMGNEFGHPEWIDFPREGNGWSYKYARRQWSLVDREDLKYKFLNAFDNAMVELVSGVYDFQALPVEKLWEKDGDNVLAFKRGDLVFVFNWNPSRVSRIMASLPPQENMRWCSTAIPRDSAATICSTTACIISLNPIPFIPPQEKAG